MNVRLNPVFKLAEGFQFILASSSPRRNALIQSIGIDFSVQKNQAKEPEPMEYEQPAKYAERCAKTKGEACLQQTEYTKKSIILAADTIVTLYNKILGKPKNANKALEMLCMLNGRCHTVITAFYLWLPKQQSFILGCCSSIVHFYNWPMEVLKSYVKSGDPLDKAGAYGIQGTGAFLIEKIEGSSTNVTGLPLAQITALLLQNNYLIPA